MRVVIYTHRGDNQINCLEATEMEKAKYIGKWIDTSYGQCMIHLEYEYRGHRYEVTENRCKGNIPLSWQHANEQGRIDELIEMESKPKKPYRYEDTAEYGFELFWQSVN